MWVCLFSTPTFVFLFPLTAEILTVGVRSSIRRAFKIKTRVFQRRAQTITAEESKPEKMSPSVKTPVPLPPARAASRLFFPNDMVVPDPVEVPKSKAFRFAERYRSPTDLLMSPVSRGLVAKNRKTAVLSLQQNRIKVLD